MTGKDESVTFSLKELAKLEDERIEAENRTREAREKAAAAAREEEARKEREALAARDREAAEERERARFREMEEEARREAMSRAAVEQARITVEARTRSEEAERERRHELELQRMRAETVRKPGPGGFIGSGLVGAAFTFAACLVLYFAVAKPAAERRIADLDRTVATAETRANELSSRIEEQKTQIARLENQVNTLQADNASLRGPAPVKPTNPGGGFKPPVVVAPNKPKNPNDGPPCNKWDPLCYHIGN